MNLVRYRTTSGVRVAIVGDEGRKYLPVITLDSSGLRIAKVDKAEARYMQPIEGTTCRRAARRFLKYGREVGITKSAKTLLRSA